MGTSTSLTGTVTAIGEVTYRDIHRLIAAYEEPLANGAIAESSVDLSSSPVCMALLRALADELKSSDKPGRR